MCSATCNGGTQTRPFVVETAAENGGAACLAADGSRDHEPCNTQACGDCVGEWSDWGACSADCGGGTRTRVYTVSQAAEDGGSADSCAAADAFVDEEPCDSGGCANQCACEHGTPASGDTCTQVMEACAGCDYGYVLKPEAVSQRCHELVAVVPQVFTLPPGPHATAVVSDSTNI